MDEEWTIVAKLKEWSKEQLRNTVKKKDKETNLLRKVLMETWEREEREFKLEWKSLKHKKPPGPNKNNSKGLELGNTTVIQTV